MTIQWDYYAETQGLPRGLQFCPTDLVIIEYYLRNKVWTLADNSMDTIIDSDDVYGDFMEVIKFFQVRRMDCLHFYTKLKNKNKNGNQIDRTNNYGTWKCQNDSKICSDPPNNKNHIGSKRSFSFSPKKGVQDIGRWTMLEYRLDGQYRDTTNDHHYVICQIKMKEEIEGVVYQSEQERENGGMDNSINRKRKCWHGSEEFWEDLGNYMNSLSPNCSTEEDSLCFTYYSDYYVKNLGLPRGFQFCPSEPLIVEYYLLNKVNRIPDYSKGIIIESDDVYGNFKKVTKFFQERGMNCLYFYTKLKKKKNEDGIQIDRTNSHGTWKAKQKYKIVSDTIHIGYKRSFTFFLADNICSWTMQEYGLGGKYAKIANPHSYVICRITKQEGKKDPVNQSEQQRENGGMDNTNPSLLVSEPPLLGQLEENVQPVGHFNNIGLITDAVEDSLDPELQALISSPSNPPILL